MAVIGLVERAAARRSSSDSGWPSVGGTCGLALPSPGPPVAPGLRQEDTYGGAAAWAGAESHRTGRAPGGAHLPLHSGELKVNLSLSLDAALSPRGISRGPAPFPEVVRVAAGGEPGPPRGPHWAGAAPSRSRARGEGPASPLLWTWGGQGAPPRPAPGTPARPPLGRLETGSWPTAAASPGVAGLCHLVPSALSFLRNHVMEETLRVPSHLRHPRGPAGPPVQGHQDGQASWMSPRLGRIL